MQHTAAVGTSRVPWWNAHFYAFPSALSRADVAVLPTTTRTTTLSMSDACVMGLAMRFTRTLHHYHHAILQTLELYMILGGNDQAREVPIGHRSRDGRENGLGIPPPSRSPRRGRHGHVTQDGEEGEEKECGPQDASQPPCWTAAGDGGRDTSRGFEKRGRHRVSHADPLFFPTREEAPRLEERTSTTRDQAEAGGQPERTPITNDGGEAKRHIAEEREAFSSCSENPLYTRGDETDDVEDDLAQLFAFILPDDGWAALHRLWVDLKWVVDELLRFTILLRNSRHVESYCTFLASVITTHPTIQCWMQALPHLPPHTPWHLKLCQRYLEALTGLPCYSPLTTKG